MHSQAQKIETFFNFYVLNLYILRNKTNLGSFLRFWGGRDEARKGGCVRAKSQDATDGRVISQKKSESLINMRKMEGKSSGNARFSGKLYFGHKKLDRNEYDSRRAFVVHSDTKLPKVENMESLAAETWNCVVCGVHLKHSAKH